MRPFHATVVRGKQLGRTLGFPTANLAAGEAVPLRGVYAAYITVNGAKLPAMMNIGTHPTVPEGPPTIEANIINWQGDIYGAQVLAEPVAFLRAEQRFDSIDALKAQLQMDVTNALQALAQHRCEQAVDPSSGHPGTA